MGTMGELHEVLAQVFSGRLKPVLDKTFPLSEARAAHQYLEKSEQFGKVVDDVVGGRGEGIDLVGPRAKVDRFHPNLLGCEDVLLQAEALALRRFPNWLVGVVRPRDCGASSSSVIQASLP